MDQKDKLRHIQIEVTKEESSFVYFILEAHDNLCFYSTLKHNSGDSHRLVDIKCPLELEDILFHAIEKLKEKFSITIKLDTIIQ